MIYDVPGSGKLELKTIILDLNGTLTVRGVVVDGVKERLAKLKDLGYRIILFTGNTRRDADRVASDLGIDWRQTTGADDKKHEALKLEPESCASIGNGLIDAELMKVVKLRIVTLQSEGIHIETMLNADIIIPTIIDALDLLVDPNILVATLRK